LVLKSKKFKVKRVCEVLKTSRAAYYKKGKKMKSRYTKNDDEQILKDIIKIKEVRPTYGYKRVMAMLNRERVTLGLQKYNKKRIYRIMSLNDLLLLKYPKRQKHEGNGKVMTLHSNTRWCSDAFEIHCFNGEKVYVAFSLDCKDRELISYVANDRQVQALDIQKLMRDSVLKRFEDVKTPKPIQWLSDRGTVYRAHRTCNTARELGLLTCYTAPYSPSSNGMAEALVHTIKRDYVYLADCKDAKTVLKLLPEWFADYNNVAPHSALNMMSPSQFKAIN